MSITSQIPPALLEVCTHWSRKMQALAGDEAGRIELIRNELPALLLKKSFFSQILKKIALGHPYPDLRLATLFDSEIVLFLDPRHQFSLRVYFYGPGEYSPVHDHSAWGISGHLSGSLGVVTYRRSDDGAVSDYARLHESTRVTLTPGETILTRPLNEGIHKTGNPGNDTIAMISVYGSPMRRLYINGFDPQQSRVYRMYPPKLRKKLLAAQVLKSLE